MTEGLIGIIGILVGVLLNELFRRSNRIENYSSRIFDKRLQIYEELLARLQETSEFVSDIVKAEELQAEEKHESCHPKILNLLGYCDSNQLYLNDEIIVHIGATFCRIGEIIDSDDQAFRDSEFQEFWRDINNAKGMIKAESGIEEMNALFKKITKAKHSSPIIEYYRRGKSD